MKTNIQVEKQWNSGVTILEVLIVLTIMALVAAIAGPRVIGYLGRAKSDVAQLQITQIDSALQLYFLDTGRYPSPAEGLGVLLSPSVGTAGWAGPYLKDASALEDPWGRPYLYNLTEKDVNISSLGRDGRSGGTGEDRDIAN